MMQWKQGVGKLAGWLLVVTLMVSGIAFAQEQKALAEAAPVPKEKRTRENWTDLSLAGSQLKAQPALIAEKAERPQFVREMIQLLWREGDPVEVYVIKPTGVAKPPVALYLYGFPSETKRFLDDEYCKRLTFRGVAAVGFVSALTGPRYHGRPMKEWFVSELQESLGSTVHDVQMLLNYLDSRGDLDMNKVGMFGQGSGGTIAILAAATDSRIKNVDVLDPWGDWPNWVVKTDVIPQEERAKYQTAEFLKSVAGLDPVDFLPKLKAQHLRILHVMDDVETPKIAKERMEGAAPKSAEIQRFEDTKQFFANVSGGRLFDWLKGQLLPLVADSSATQKAAASASTMAPNNH